MLLTSSSACLVSPVDPPILEPALNHHPNIVHGTAQPQPTATPLTVGCDGEYLDQDFEVRQVIEYDLDQLLYFRWFIDWDPGAVVQSVPFAQPDGLPPVDDDPLREVNQKVRVPLGWIAQGRLYGPHLVEVVVSDAPPLSSGPAPFRTLPEGAAADTHWWVIEVLDDASCP